MTENTNTIQEILSISYNQDQGSFVCGTIYGFKVYNTYPFKKVLIRDLGGSICLAEMLYRTNILALVGGGPIPKYAPNKVLLWDDHRGKFGGEMKFKSDVKSIKLRQNKIAIALQDKIYVYKLQDLTVLTSIETCYNPKGMFCFSVNETVLCCPDKEEIGFFNILNLESKSLITKKAHSTSVAYMEISPKGDLIATTSENGTLLRVFSATDGTLVHEFRRGTDHVTIQSISFSLDSGWLSCNTDTGKIDIFSLEGDKPSSKKEPPKNTKSKLSFLKVVHPYFDSQWSYAHLDRNYKRANLVFLTQGNLKLIVVTTYEGSYHLISFDAKHGKDGMELEKGNFLALDPTQQ